MFDSAAGGVVPICVLAALVGGGCSFLHRWWLRAFFAIVIPIGIGYAWFWLPQLIAPQAHGDPLRPWDLIAATYWSMFAVPTSLVALVLSRLARAKGAAMWPNPAVNTDAPRAWLRPPLARRLLITLGCAMLKAFRRVPRLSLADVIE